MPKSGSAFVFLALLGQMIGATGAEAAATPDYIAAAIASVGRPPSDMARDAARKPDQVVAFAGVKPGAKVLELAPGRGYYTRVLSKVVGPAGHVYALGYGSPPGAPAANGPAASSVDNVYRLSQADEFSNITAILAANMIDFIGLPEQVDVVWTSDNYHDFHNRGPGPRDAAALNKAVFEVLKPGGVYLVVDHAAAPGAGVSQTSTLHRIDPETVKTEVLAAGFVLDRQSDMLARPSDDRSKPSFATGDDTDELVMRFRKPETAAKAPARPYDQMTAYYGNTLVLGTPANRTRTIFYQPDRTYQEFGADGITNGVWYLDVNNNNCMRHQTEKAGMEATVACRPMDFPKSKNPKVGDVIPAGPQGGISVALLPGRVYPNAIPSSPKDPVR